MVTSTTHQGPAAAAAAAAATAEAATAAGISLSTSSYKPLQSIGTLLVSYLEFRWTRPASFLLKRKITYCVEIFS